MALGIYLNESVLSSPLVRHNKKQNRRVVDLRTIIIWTEGRSSSSSCSQWGYAKPNLVPSLASTTLYLTATLGKGSIVFNSTLWLHSLSPININSRMTFLSSCYLRVQDRTYSMRADKLLSLLDIGNLAMEKEGNFKFSVCQTNPLQYY